MHVRSTIESGKTISHVVFGHKHNPIQVISQFYWQMRPFFYAHFIGIQICHMFICCIISLGTSFEVCFLLLV